MENREYEQYIKDKAYCERLNEFLEYEAITDSKAENTIKSYSHTIDVFLKLMQSKKKLHGMGDTQLKKIDRKDLMEYQTKLRKEGFAFSTINNKMSAIYEFFKFLEYSSILKSPYVNIKKLRLPTREMDKLTTKEMDSILKAVRDDYNYFNDNKVRDRALFVMAMNTGMRISEITELTIDCIKGNKVRIIGKGNKERTIFIHESLKIALDEWLEQRTIILRDNGVITNYIFLNNTGTDRILSENADKIFKYYGEIAGISKDKCHFHILRHSYASLMVHSKVSLTALQKLLGHKYITTTQIYTHTDDDDLEEASGLVNIG